MLKKILLPALALMAIIAFPALADEKETSRDDIIAADVFRVIDSNVFYTSFDLVDFEVKDGVVTLSGFVTSPYKKSNFEKNILKKVEGVSEVSNQIQVLPPSSFDDRIRYTVAVRLYNDDRLLRYNINRYRLPIHVIVRNGSVRLEGTVANKMDSRLVESNIRGITGIVSVDNNLKIDSE